MASTCTKAKTRSIDTKRTTNTNPIAFDLTEKLWKMWEPLHTLAEFNAQQQWCNSNDRLTFILLNKQLYHDYWLLKNAKNQLIDLLQFNNEKYSDNENAEIFSMIGDVNLFITYSHSINDIEGELSVMIAESSYRGQGLAAEALAGILEYSGRHLPMKLTSLVAKVSMNNEKSICFFRNRLKFIERSRNTVFNEVGHLE
ncbi:N-acetyltransferase 9-like protein [Schistosoma japonicum]|uniref:N-acetyltransferase 9-like protein n=1 Tax=Schistosoma japonicum TaxID=6182 RepID=A0A4Z2D3I1_SCHJA|nr:N-acetyltransferase 9-like protein [Schistosoma japonicum]